MDDRIHTAIEEFQALMTRRLNHRVHTTEDSIRYTFFAALIASGFSPETIALEYPHPNLPRKELDAVILAETGNPEIALEFKYHRDVPSGAATPRPMKAGQIFFDLARLVELRKARERYFVYVTDATMAGYLRNQPSPLSDFFGLGEGTRLEVAPENLAGLTKTFHSEMGKLNGKFWLTSVLRRDLPRRHYARIYMVEVSDGGDRR